MLFHHGFLDTEHLMNYDLNSAEEYFKDESNNECMMTLCAYGTQKRWLENNKEKRQWLCKRMVKCARGNGKKKWEHLGDWTTKLCTASERRQKKKKKKSYKQVKTLRRNLNTELTQFKWQEGKVILLDKLWMETELKLHLKQYVSLAQGLYFGFMM